MLSPQQTVQVVDTNTEQLMLAIKHALIKNATESAVRWHVDVGGIESNGIYVKSVLSLTELANDILTTLKT